MHLFTIRIYQIANWSNDHSLIFMNLLLNSHKLSSCSISVIFLFCVLLSQRKSDLVDVILNLCANDFRSCSKFQCLKLLIRINGQWHTPVSCCIVVEQKYEKESNFISSGVSVVDSGLLMNLSQSVSVSGYFVIASLLTLTCKGVLQRILERKDHGPSLPWCLRAIDSWLWLQTLACILMEYVHI
jgi:hypothetical protein